MAIMRIRFTISGLQGLPGLHTTYWNGSSSSPVQADAADVAGRVRAFWDSFKANIPTGVTITAVSSVDVLDPATGTLTGGLSAGTVAIVSGTGTGELPAATMLLLKLQTGTIIAGRRLQGRNFIGPLPTAANTFGIPTAAVNTALVTAAGFLLTGATSSAQVVWHRPKGTPPAGGSAVPVITWGTSPVFAVLRSRRD